MTYRSTTQIIFFLIATSLLIRYALHNTIELKIDPDCFKVNINTNIF